MLAQGIIAIVVAVAIAYSVIFVFIKYLGWTHVKSLQIVATSVYGLIAVPLLWHVMMPQSAVMPTMRPQTPVTTGLSPTAPIQPLAPTGPYWDKDWRPGSGSR